MNDQFIPIFTTIIPLTGATLASTAYTQSTASGLQGTEISNLTTNGAYAAFGSSSVVATIPTTSASTNGFYIPPSAKNLRYVSPPGVNSYISAISTGNTLAGALAVTVGSYM